MCFFVGDYSSSKDNSENVKYPLSLETLKLIKFRNQNFLISEVLREK